MKDRQPLDPVATCTGMSSPARAVACRPRADPDRFGGHTRALGDRATARAPGPARPERRPRSRRAVLPERVRADGAAPALGPVVAARARRASSLIPRRAEEPQT